MAEPIKKEELIDIDGLRAALGDYRRDYVDMANQILQLNASLKKSTDDIEASLRNMQKRSSAHDDSRTITEQIQQAQQLGAQLANQRTASAALATTRDQLEKVTGSLVARQEELLNQYASISGNTGREIQLRKRLAAELAANQTQLDRVAKTSKYAGENAREVTGQYNRMNKELSDARKALKNLDDAFDSNTGKLNRNNAEAVRLAGIINRNDSALRQYDETFRLHSRNIGDYPKNMGRVTHSLLDLAAGYVTLDAAFGAVDRIKDATVNMEKYQTVLTNTLGSQQAATEALDMLQRFGDKNQAVNVDALTQSFINLANRGFVPTEKELTKLSDLAIASNKSIDQLAEAILDAQTGENERLKEFGITASKSGDQITFSFRGQATTVKATGAEIQKYILSLGDLKGIAGTTAALSKQLTGDISDTGNAAMGFFRKVGQYAAPFISLFFQTASSAFRGLTNLMKSSAEEAKDSLQVYEDQTAAVKGLNDEIAPLLTRYDQLTAKAKQVGGETNLSKTEQIELKNAINRISEVIPSAISAQNEYGRVMAINTGVARDYITEQERVAKVLNADSINKYNESLTLTKRRMADLQKQLVMIQGATPTPNGGPAVSEPTNTGQSTGFKLPGLSEQQKVSEIARIQKELIMANDEAKNLSATIDYLSGKAPKAASAIPGSTPSTTTIGKGENAEKEADKRLKKALDTARKEAEVTVSALEVAYESGAITEADYLNRRLITLQDGILKEQALLRKAGKENSDEYQETQKRLNEVATDYVKKRSDIEEKAFKNAVDAVKKAIEVEAGELQGALTQKLADLQTAYIEEESNIRSQVAKGQLSEGEGEKRLYNLKLQLLRDMGQAQANNSATIIRQSEQRLKVLEDDLRAQGRTEVEIEKALEDERDRLRKERLDAEKNAADARVKVAETEAEKKKRLEDEEKEVRKRTEETYWEAAGAAANSYFELTAAFRQQDINRLDRDKDQELKILDKKKEAGILTEAEAASARENIEQRYAAKSVELKRRQARADKAQAAFNVILSTSQAVMKTFEQFGFVVGTPLAIAMGALGAIQLATILAKPLPEFFKGTQDAPEGPAWVGERGYELIESKQGGKPTYRLAAEKQIAYLNAHDRVYTHDETKKMLRHNTEIVEQVRSAPGGSMYVAPRAASGPTKGELTEAFRAAIADLPIEQHIYDERGYRQAQRRANQRREWLNSYFSLPRKGK